MDQLLDQVAKSAITPALAYLPLKMSTPDAILLMLAYGLQESGLCERCQIVDGGGKGPARGLWQFERGGGVLGVLSHPATRVHALKVCEARGVAADSRAVWDALERDDVLAAAFARLLIYSDPLALPARGDVEQAWRLYAVRTWRPGRPHRDRFGPNYQRAMAYLFGGKP